MRKLLQLTFAILLASSGSLFAQGVTTATINGKITDTNGGDLPGATVIAVHNPSGTQYGTATRADGRYTLPGVRVGGPYTITVTFVGYQEQKLENINLDLGQNFTADFKLGESTVELSEVQVVATKDPVLNSDRTGAATNVRREQFERLPSIGRNFQDFTALDPRASGFSFGGRSNLYNNFTIDGSTSNNVFGLSALPGGQTASQPIGVDAIENVQVSIAPFDVRQGAFTGAGINAVTRSGTNDFSGSAYYFFKNQNMVGKKVGSVEQPQADFNFKNFGMRIGGPIIKNKLFFFVNAEKEEQVNPAVTFNVNQDKNQPIAITDKTDPKYNDPANIQRLLDFLLDNGTLYPGKTWTYDPGTYNNFNVPTQSTKFLAKIDWNINQNHKLTVRYNQLSSYRDIPPSNSGGLGSGPNGGRQNSVNAIPFSKSFYRQNNNLKSIIAELNSTFGNKYSNQLTLGYSGFRDFREQGGGGTPPNFPTVDILGPNGSNLTTIGPDPFTPNNKLDQDIIQVNDNFNIYLPNNTITIGTANEFFKFTNVFTQQITGVYQYSSIDNFIQNSLNPTPVDAPAGTVSNAPNQYLLQYSAVAGNPAPGAVWKAAQLGFYAQDEYTGLKNVKAILGLRVDLPVFNTTLPQNEISDAMTFNGGETVKVGELPKTTPLFSPRLGINWDVFGDKTLQVRGGTGVFTGRVPFVWMSNQVTNNGLLFGSIIASSQAAAASYPFNPVPLTSTGVAPTFAINAAVNNFKFPQVWRTNIGVDKLLPGNMIGTLEAIFTKDINAVYIRDANMSDPIRTVDGDGREQFAATINGTATNPGRRINQNITQALVLDNSNKGYQLALTAQLQKSFEGGFYASGAYTFTDSRDVNSQSASTANSIFTGYPTVNNPNGPVLSYSSNFSKHRIVASASWRKEYAKHFASTVSAIYTGFSGNQFSYTYGGDMNSDGISNNDLMYIPRSKDEIILTTTSATDTRTVDEIWNQLDNYIKQDKYLNSHRGEYAARNAATAPWVHVLNFRYLQDVYVNVGKSGKRNTLQFSVELINALNLINSDWGVIKNPTRAGLLNFVGYENPAVTTSNTQTNPLLPNNSTTTTPASGRPVFTFPTASDGSALKESFTNSTALGSRYQLQFGLRYIFN